MSKATILHADDAAKVMYGAGDSYRFLVSNAESNGRIFAMEAVVPPGGGPPLHIQTREDEAFYILEGEVTFWADGNRVVARTGTFIHMPPDVAHRFQNEGDSEARMLIWFSPAGIEAMFDEMAGDPENYAAIGPKHGVTFMEVGDQP